MAHGRDRERARRRSGAGRLRRRSSPAPGWTSRPSPSTPRAERSRPARAAGRRRRAARARRRRPSPTSPSTASWRPRAAAAWSAVLPVPPALAGNARSPPPSRTAGLVWVGPDAEVLERLGGDGVEPASERGFLAWVTADGPAVRHRRSPATARPASPGSPGRRGRAPDGAARRRPAGWPTSAGAVWSPSASTPDGELAEVAAGFSLDMAVLERAHGVDAVELALRSAAGARRPAPRAAREPRAAVVAQLRVDPSAGHAGPGHRPAAGDRPRPARGRGRRAGRRQRLRRRATALDGWYDALLATVSAGGARRRRPRPARSPRRCSRAARDRRAARRRRGAARCCGRLAEGRSTAPTRLTPVRRRAWMRPAQR